MPILEAKLKRRPVLSSFLAFKFCYLRYSPLLSFCCLHKVGRKIFYATNLVEDMETILKLNTSSSYEIRSRSWRSRTWSSPPPTNTSKIHVWYNFLRILTEHRQKISYIHSCKYLQPRILYLTKLSLRIKGEIKNFSDMKKLKEYTNTNPILKEILKSSLKRKETRVYMKGKANI